MRLKFDPRSGTMALAILTLTQTYAASPTATVQYNRDIRPIISENCFACHGSDPSSRKAHLRLDSFETATLRSEDSPPAIVPGRPDQSEMIRRIFDEGDDLMPPEESNKTLTEAQKKLLKRWIAEGAKYQAHWAFVAPTRPELPKVKNARWVRNPLDRFILARLEQERLKPAPEADRRTLARRVSLDLTGLPPAPEQLTAFLKDKSPNPYERFVDQLLASPQWGEHRGRYWLDAARYGDTHGIHFDNYREMWTYRDWVINAFNRNLPFDEFTIENLAGDLLPQATRDQQIASGFNRCNITSNEGGAIDEEYKVLYARDRTETTSQVWLGLTAGCAVCHDHKYDPITQKDFYSLSAFFNNTTQKAMDGNIKDTPPVILLPKPADETRWQQLTLELPAAEKSVAARKEMARGDFTNWLAQPDFAAIPGQLPTSNLVFQARLSEGAGEAIQCEVDGATQSVSLGQNTNWQSGAIAEKAYTVSGQTAPAFAEVGDFERTNAFSYAAWVRVEGDKNGALFGRMADKDGQFRGWDLWLGDGRPTFHFIHDWPTNTLKVAGKKALPKDQWNHVCVTYDGTSKAKGVKIYVNGELQKMEVQKNALTGTTRTDVPFKLGQRDTMSAVENAGLQDVKLFARELRRDEILNLIQLPRLQWLASKPADQRTKKEGDEVFSIWLDKLDAPYRERVQAQEKLKTEESEIRARGAVAYVMQERTNAPEAYVLFRGEYDKRRDRVTPDTPGFLPAMPPELPHNRLGFAEWLVRPENPLMARVTVNRFWQEVFGAGIVETTGDFGVAGEWPSHPELLDWLAVEFRESGWNVKKLFKLMVMSATYRQSAVTTREKVEKDPQNRLLARGPRFRMDAEMVRDYALAASGLLVEKIGGPSVRPYQPPGIWEMVGMPGGDTRKYVQDQGDSLYRRSVYTFWKRQAPPASMEVFNAPSREVCTVRRERTDTPLQALVTLNDPQFVEAARHLAQESLQQGKINDSARLDFMALRLLARPLSAKERKIVNGSLGGLLAHYRQVPDEARKLLAVGDSPADATLDVPTLAAYTMVANQLLNLDEVLNK